jgi:hypothetical protein
VEKPYLYKIILNGRSVSTAGLEQCRLQRLRSHGPYFCFRHNNDMSLGKSLPRSWCPYSPGQDDMEEFLRFSVAPPFYNNMKQGKLKPLGFIRWI